MHVSSQSVRNLRFQCPLRILSSRPVRDAEEAQTRGCAVSFFCSECQECHDEAPACVQTEIAKARREGAEQAERERDASLRTTKDLFFRELEKAQVENAALKEENARLQARELEWGAALLAENAAKDEEIARLKRPAGPCIEKEGGK